jgi:hypothetical protein
MLGERRSPGNQSGLCATDMVTGPHEAGKPLLDMELDNPARFQHYTFNGAGEAQSSACRGFAWHRESWRRGC